MAAPRRRGGFESRWTVVNGVRLHHRTSTDHPTGTVAVVFVHGLAVSHRYMMPTARRLAAQHPVHLPDLPGFGLSAEPGWNLDVAEHADYLVGWLDAVGLEQVVLLGNSFGCQVAVDLSVRYPDRVRSLILASPTTDPTARTASRQLWRWLRDVPREDPRQAPIVALDVRDAGPRRVVATFRASLRDPIEAKLPGTSVQSWWCAEPWTRWRHNRGQRRQRGWLRWVSWPSFRGLRTASTTAPPSSWRGSCAYSWPGPRPPAAERNAYRRDCAT
jgi:pimeloyl-ACP methyl ester carboxylesterase